MIHTESSVMSRDGVNLRLQQWRPDNMARAVVVLTHGHGEHSGRYGHVASALCEVGFAVWAYDLRGHGRSGGQRGHAPDYDHLLDDLHIVVDQARLANEGLKLFLFGHSMGGTITLMYVLRRKPEAAGLMTTGALLVPRFLPPGWKIALARGLSGIWPTFTQQTGLNQAVPMSHDTELLNSFPDLHLAHTSMSARLGVGILSASIEALARAGELSMPLLVMHGQDDGAMDPAGTQMIYERASSDDKTLRLYPGLYHEILNETERGAVLQDIIDWLSQRA